jgi:hypothetical protein
VALTVTAIVFTALFGVFNRVTDVAGNIEKKGRLSQEARLVMLQIQRDLESMVRSPANATGSQESASNATQPVPFAGYSPNSDLFLAQTPILEFSTRSDLDANATFPGNRIHKVAYWLEQNGEENGRAGELHRSQVPLVNTVSEAGNGEQQPEQVLLSSRIQSLHLAFYDPEENRMVSSWGREESGQRSGGLKPPPFVLVQVRFTLDDSVSKRFISLHQLGELETDISYLPELITE